MTLLPLPPITVPPTSPQYLQQVAAQLVVVAQNQVIAEENLADKFGKILNCLNQLGRAVVHAQALQAKVGTVANPWVDQ